MAAKREVGLRAIITPDFSEASAALTEMTKVAKKEISDILGKAGDSFLSPKKMLAMRKAMLATSHEISRLEAAGDKKAARALTIRLQSMLKTNEKIIRQNEDALKEWQDISQKSAKDWSESVTGGLKSAFDGLKSGDLTGLFSNALQGALKSVPGLAKGAQKKADDLGIDSKLLSGFLGALGPIAIGIGAVVGAFAALAGLILEADSSVKAFNADLMGTGVVIADMTTDLWSGTEAFNKYRGMASKLSQDMGITKEDINQIVGGFNDGSKTLKELTQTSAGAKTEMDALSQNIQASTKWARLLNMSYKESAEMMATQSEELGTTIEGVGKRFGAVYDAAQLSGFSVKRFFNMVLQATSGMQMYNMKLEESAGLLLMLSKILGSKMGGEFLQNLSKKFTDESYQDAYKRVLTTGTKVTKAGAKHSAKNAAVDVVGKIGDKLKDMKEGEKDNLLAVFKEVGMTEKDLAGLASNDPKQQEASAKALQELVTNMNPKEQAKLLSGVQREGSAEMATKLDALMHLSDGASGNMMDLAASQKYFGGGDVLVSELHSMESVLAKPLWKLTNEDMINAQGTTGKSRGELDELVYIGKSMAGNFDHLEDLQKSGQKFTQEEQQKQLEQMGAYIDDTGAIVTGVVKDEAGVKTIQKTGEVGGVDDLIRAQGDRFSSLLAEPMDAQTAAAEAVQSNTLDMMTMMKIYGDFLMNQVYDVLIEIREGIFGLPMQNADAAKARAQGDKNARNDYSKAAGVVSEKASKVDELEAKLKKAAKGDERIQLSTELEAAKKELDDAKAKMQEKGATINLLKKGKEEIDVSKAVNAPFQKDLMDSEGVGDVAMKYLGNAIGIPRLALKGYQSIRDEAPIEQLGANSKMREVAGLREKSDEMYGKELGDLSKEQLETLQKENDLTKDQINELMAINQTFNQTSRDAAFGNEKAQAELLQFQKTEFPEDLAKKITEAEEKNKLIGALGSIGIDQDRSEQFAEEILKTNQIPPELLAKLAKEPVLRDVLEERDLGRSQGLFKKHDDFLLRMDGQGRVTPIVEMDPADNLSVIGTKAGGAAHQAGAGGSVRATSGGGGVQVIHNHFYNDARANFQQTQKILKSMRK